MFDPKKRMLNLKDFMVRSAQSLIAHSDYPDTLCLPPSLSRFVFYAPFSTIKSRSIMIPSEAQRDEHVSDL